MVLRRQRVAKKIHIISFRVSDNMRIQIEKNTDNYHNMADTIRTAILKMINDNVLLDKFNKKDRKINVMTIGVSTPLFNLINKFNKQNKIKTNSSLVRMALSYYLV